MGVTICYEIHQWCLTPRWMVGEWDGKPLKKQTYPIFLWFHQGSWWFLSQTHAPWCWNIYQHLPEQMHSNVGKYTIHGAYGKLWFWQTCLTKFTHCIESEMVIEPVHSRSIDQSHVFEYQAISPFFGKIKLIPFPEVLTMVFKIIKIIHYKP